MDKSNWNCLTYNNIQKSNFAREKERETLLKVSLKSDMFYFFIFVLLYTLP